jgi:hypothetical protein
MSYENALNVWCQTSLMICRDCVYHQKIEILFFHFVEDSYQAQRQSNKK